MMALVTQQEVNKLLSVQKAELPTVVRFASTVQTSQIEVNATLVSVWPFAVET